MQRFLPLRDGEAGKGLRWSEDTHEAARIHASRFEHPERHHQVSPNWRVILRVASFLWDVARQEQQQEKSAIVLLSSVLDLSEYLTSFVVESHLERRGEVLATLVRVDHLESLEHLIEMAWIDCDIFGVFFGLLAAADTKVNLSRLEGRRQQPVEIQESVLAYMGKYHGESDYVFVAMNREFWRDWKRLLVEFG